MKYKLLVLILISFNVLAREQRNAIILVDTGFNEYKAELGSFATNEVCNAMRDNVAPIIVSGSVLYTFLYTRDSIAPELHSMALEVMEVLSELKKYVEREQIEKLMEKLQTYTSVGIEGRQKEVSELLENISKIKQNMEEVRAKNHDLFVRFNKELVKKRLPEISLENILLFASLGKSFDSLYVVNFLGLSLSNSDWNIYKAVDSSLGNDLYLLVPKGYKEKIGLSEGDEKMEEHLGFRVESPDVLRKIGSFEELRTILNKDWGGLTKSIQVKTPHFANIATDNKKIQKLFVASKGQDSLEWNIFILGHGYPGYAKNKKRTTLTKTVEFLGYDLSRSIICNIKLDGFLEFLTFLSQEIRTKHVAYETCYGGGWHSKVIGECLDKLEQNKDLVQAYNVISCSIADAASYGPHNFNFFNNTDNWNLVKESVSRAFGLFGGPIMVRAHESKKFEIYSFKPYEILTSGVTRELYIGQDYDLYLDVPQVNFKLVIKNIGTILSLRSGEFVHKFKDIDLYGNLSDFLMKAFLSSELTKKVFLIDNLVSTQDATIKVGNLLGRKTIKAGTKLKLIVNLEYDLFGRQMFLAVKGNDIMQKGSDGKVRMVEGALIGAYKTPTIHSSDVFPWHTLSNWNSIPVSEFDREHLRYEKFMREQVN